MTEIVLPGMVARRRGLIINISSMTAVKILSNIYGATKAFVHYFSQSLSYEYEEAGVLIRVIVNYHFNLLRLESFIGSSGGCLCLVT